MLTGGAGSAQAFVSKDATTGSQYMDELEQTWEDHAQEYAPEVKTLDDGTRIQRTPTDTSYFQMYYINDGNLSYNTKYLDADHRGCNSCHDDLGQTVKDMDFFHVEVENGLGTTITADDCRICHTYGSGYVDRPGQFGSLIHGLHNACGVVNNCMACHNATEGGGMELWDDVKYDVLQGISSVPDVQGSLVVDQDVKTDKWFDESWFYTDSNTTGIARGYAGEDNPDSYFDQWDFTVSGLVNEPFNETLANLIAQAEADGATVTDTYTGECIMNSPGGEQIANVEITGIPFSWLIEKAGGVKEGASPTAIVSFAPDGWNRGGRYEKYLDTGAYLVYKINGKNLPWQNGFPCMTFWPGQGIPASIRWANEISVVDTPLSDLKIWENAWALAADDLNPANDVSAGHGLTSDQKVVYYTKTNAGFAHIKEGQILEAGPHTFEGWAWDTSEKIASVEFSMDGGATWTSFDTSDTDRLKWVYWYFTTDLEPGAYVLEVRAVTESGDMTYQPDKIFFNVEATQDDAEGSVDNDA